MTAAVGPRAPETIPAIQGGPSVRKRRIGGARLFSWIVFVVGVLYFLVPLYATLEFSLETKVPGAAYSNILFKDPQFLGSLGYSFVIGVITIVVSLLIIVPTAYWVRLRLPRLRPVVEFVTLLPFVIPPVILVFGLLRAYSGPVPLTASDLGLNVLVVAAYVVLSFPYMYRAVDSGLQAIDIRSLTEAAQSMGAGWARILLFVIFPNIRVALLSGAFLTLAIVLGEYTIASFLVRPAFGPYLFLLGRDKAFEPAAASIISFGLTWLAMGMIAFLGRGSRTSVQVAGAR
jgi:putative spermidine/putrescine transport system permease protein